MKIVKKSQNYYTRQIIILIILPIIFILFCYQIINIHSTKVNEITLSKKAYLQAEIQQKHKHSRGSIVDRNGNILATSLIKKYINIDPTIIQDDFITPLANAVKMPDAELREQIQAKRQASYGQKHLIIKKNLSISDEIIKNIEKLKTQKILICKDSTNKKDNKIIIFIENFMKINDNKNNNKNCNQERISGVYVQSENIRYYPQANIMSSLIGKINKENIGISGVEGEFDYLLQAKDGQYKFSAEKDDSNIYYKKQILSNGQAGNDLKLTIDTDIQFHVHNAIEQSAKLHLAESVSAIVLSKNGEILAMANYPSSDPNDNKQYDAKNYRNRVLADKLEPGSTMKTFTILLALDKNLISANDDELIDVTESIMHIKSDAEARKYGDAITIKKILQKSHNLGTVKVMQKLNPVDVYNTWKKLGFGEYLNIMPNTENPGLIRHHSDWSITDKITIAYGHGPMNTNLAQLARAYLVFANDGVMPKLKLIQEPLIQYYDEEENTKVFSKKATDKIKTILNSVASNEGSGYRSVIEGYEVGGKTGTAEMIINGQYSKDGFKNTYFVGFTPVDNPKYIMAVRIENPKQCFTSWNPDLRDRCEGSNSAAMTFKNAMEKILQIDDTIMPIMEVN